MIVQYNRYRVSYTRNTAYGIDSRPGLRYLLGIMDESGEQCTVVFAYCTGPASGGG
jgi:hypothetical protein